jgi:UPF0716 protein FxsA
MKALLILVAVIALPFLEIWAAIWAAEQVGWGPVIVAGALVFGFGIAMVRRAMQAWGRLATRAQSDPGFLNTGFGPAIGDAGLLLAGGILMIIPGFITAIAGLLLVFPPTRRLLGRAFGGRLSTMASRQGYQRVTIIEGETVTSYTEPPAGPAGYGAQASSNTSGPVIISGEIVAGPSDGAAGDGTPDNGTTKRPDRPSGGPGAL